MIPEFSVLPDATAPVAKIVRSHAKRGVACIDSSRLLENFRPEHAEFPVPTEVRFCLYGSPGLPVVAILGGISASRHVLDSPDGASRGWWRSVVGPGAGVNTDRYQVLSLDYFTGLDCEPGVCPSVSTSDQANLLAGVLDTLGIEKLHACVGASYGAMVTLAFASRHPRRLGRLVAISGADRAHPMATAFRSLQREIVRFGLRQGAGTDALQIARALGLITYRSHVDYARRFARAPVEGYLLNRAQSFAARFSPEAFLRLSVSLDTHHIDAGNVRTPATLIAADPDMLVPVEQMHGLACRLSGPTKIFDIRSRYGHDAFLKEHIQIAQLLDSALTEGLSHG